LLITNTLHGRKLIPAVFFSHSNSPPHHSPSMIGEHFLEWLKSEVTTVFIILWLSFFFLQMANLKSNVNIKISVAVIIFGIDKTRMDE
jgi:hypothetical protein